MTLIFSIFFNPPLRVVDLTVESSSLKSLLPERNILYQLLVLFTLLPVAVVFQASVNFEFMAQDWTDFCDKTKNNILAITDYRPPTHTSRERYQLYVNRLFWRKNWYAQCSNRSNEPKFRPRKHEFFGRDIPQFHTFPIQSWSSKGVRIFRLELFQNRDWKCRQFIRFPFPTRNLILKINITFGKYERMSQMILKYFNQNFSVTVLCVQTNSHLCLLEIFFQSDSRSIRTQWILSTEFTPVDRTANRGMSTCVASGTEISS